MNIGDKLKNLRIENNLKQNEVADKLFISEKTISSWENNRTIPDLNMIYKLSNIYKTSFIYLIDTSLDKDINDELCIRIKIDNFDGILDRYKNFDKKKIHQIDKYYNNQKDKWLRLRNEDEKNILSYKEKINDSYFIKYNVQIDNYNSMDTIITKLGFTELGIIEKNRIKLKLDDNIIINFDYVYNIGNFIEIISLDRNYDKLIELLNELNISYEMINMKKYIEYIK